MATDVKNDANLSTNLVAYWELEETSGTRVDSHGSFDLTDNNTVGSGTGIQGTGADFERSNGDERLSYNDTTPTFNPSGDFSISLWYKHESTGSSQMLVDHGTDPSSGWLIQSESTRIFVRRDTTTGNKDGFYTVSQDTNWHHIVLTVDQTTDWRLYFDGTLRRTTSNGGNGDATTGEFKLGALLNGGSYINEMDGIIDEVGFWNKVLTSTEVSDLYNSGSGIPYDAGGGGGGPTFTPQVMWFS